MQKLAKKTIVPACIIFGILIVSYFLFAPPGNEHAVRPGNDPSASTSSANDYNALLSFLKDFYDCPSEKSVNDALSSAFSSIEQNYEELTVFDFAGAFYLFTKEYKGAYKLSLNEALQRFLRLKYEV